MVDADKECRVEGLVFFDIDAESLCAIDRL